MFVSADDAGAEIGRFRRRIRDEAATAGRVIGRPAAEHSPTSPPTADRPTPPNWRSDPAGSRLI